MTSARGKGGAVDETEVSVFFYLGLAVLLGWMLIIVVLVRHYWLGCLMSLLTRYCPGCCPRTLYDAAAITDMDDNGGLRRSAPAVVRTNAVPATAAASQRYLSKQPSQRSLSSTSSSASATTGKNANHTGYTSVAVET